MIRGLFQTKQKVGMIFAVMKINGENLYSPFCAFNDVRGENFALNLMKEEEFVMWTIDPWTGQINIRIQ